jgi:hypothetical protein
VIGAGAIVLAAMYMLRLISAALHQDVGPGGRTRRSTCARVRWRWSCPSWRACSR